MKASDWVKTLPPGGPSPAREDAVLDAIRRGDYIAPEWVPIRTEARGHHGLFYAAADTLRVGEPGDSIRVMVSATMAQEICDLLGWIMPTVKVCDLIHGQATVLVEPVLTLGNDQMDFYVDTDRARADDRMVHVNAEIDKRIAGRSGLASSFHKEWVLSAKWKLGAGAVNYGYYSPKAPDISHSGERMWQALGTRHNRFHLDDSQQYRPLLRAMIVDDERRDMGEILMSSDLSELVSDEGALSFARQPGVPESEASQ